MPEIDSTHNDYSNMRNIRDSGLMKPDISLSNLDILASYTFKIGHLPAQKLDISLSYGGKGKKGDAIIFLGN
ncbi:MAG: hypothetical protein AAFR61_12835 [Bacteroidota bacterium]